MLIFKRNINQAFMIGKDIKITVLGIKNQKAEIGITAPKKIAVHREEIFNKIHKMQSKKPCNDYLLTDQVK